MDSIGQEPDRATTPMTQYDDAHYEMKEQNKETPMETHQMPGLIPDTPDTPESDDISIESINLLNVTDDTDMMTERVIAHTESDQTRRVQKRPMKQIPLKRLTIRCRRRRNCWIRKCKK
jgi:hypothetical protein